MRENYFLDIFINIVLGIYIFEAIAPIVIIEHYLHYNEVKYFILFTLIILILILFLLVSFIKIYFINDSKIKTTYRTVLIRLLATIILIGVWWLSYLWVYDALDYHCAAPDDFLVYYIGYLLINIFIISISEGILFIFFHYNLNIKFSD